MNWNRMWIMFVARNREFFRDRASFGWNLLFPFLIIVGFGVIFGSGSRGLYKIGVFPAPAGKLAATDTAVPSNLRSVQYVEFVGFPDRDTGMQTLRNHRIDLLITAGDGTPDYWISESSPKGYMTSKLVAAAWSRDAAATRSWEHAVEGSEIRYIDWFFPGILTMNMMFSALWGVGYIIVRYRKNGVLKRLKATPLTALEYLTAQMLSRIMIMMVTVAIVWFGCDLIFDFRVTGSYFTIYFLFFIGGCGLTALGMLTAARGTSEEFASGILNFITWPMMFLSEVWFSLEGSPEWIRAVAKIFPLTHLNNGIRKVMNDGATFAQVVPEMLILSAFTVVCLVLGARLFSWNK